MLEPKIQRIYREIQKQLIYMIPEKWSKVYLYSSIFERQNSIETGELYFYYVPKGVLKMNPINVYEIPSKFNIDDDLYLRLVDKLYSEIKRLHKISAEIDGEKWNSVIISIADFKFNVEYNYSDITRSEFSSYENHLIFRYKYLEYPLSSFNKNERDVIVRYLNEYKKNSQLIKTYTEAMYELPFETIKANSKRSGIQYIKEDDIRLFEEPKEIRSQILKSDF